MWTPGKPKYEAPRISALPTSLRRLVDGLSPGSGPSSLLSRSTIAGERPDLIPIVAYLSHGDGLKAFTTALATSCALREGGTGELTLMLSWGLDREVISGVVKSAEHGGSDEITCEILIPAGEPNGTSRSISPRGPISGISGVPCDACKVPFKTGDAYTQVVFPPDQLDLYHVTCYARLVREFG